MLKWALASVVGLSVPVMAQPVETTAPAAATKSAEFYRIINEPNEIVAVLENGLTVIVKQVKSPVLTARVYVQTGGIYEGRWLGGGLSHLLEHLVAGGSTVNRTESENRAILQELGNNTNAYTTSDHTAYFINTTPDRLEQAVDLLSGWMFGATITEEEYKREYEVVQRELEKGKGEPGRVFYYLSNLNRYRVSPVRVPVIGYQEVIQGLSRDDVYEYYKLAYVPGNMIFVVVGDVDPAETLATIQNYTKDAEPGRVFSTAIPDEPPVVSPRTTVGTFPNLGQARLKLGFPTIPLDHPDLYALDLLATVLGSGESSLLVEELRDKQRLVSSVTSYNYTPHFVAGSFDVVLQLDTGKIEAATKAVLDVVESVKTQPIDADRIARAKTGMRISRVRGAQTSEDIAAQLATDFMSTGDIHFSDRYAERIQSVTADDLQRVANEWLKTDFLLTSALLPAEATEAQGLASAEAILRGAIPTTPETQSAEQPANVVTRVELPNGVILLLKRIETSPLVNVATYSLGGLTLEDAGTNGIGNLALRLATRGTTSRSAQQISEYFDSIGGEIATGMGNNSFFWTASFLRDDTETALRAYADVMLNPAFSDDELANMKTRVLAAIASQDAQWTAQATRFFREVFYGDRQLPYQFAQHGTADNVSKFSADDVRNWYQQKALTGRRVIAIYGDIDVEKTRELAAELFGQGQPVDNSNIPAAIAADPVAPAVPAGEPTIIIDKVATLKSQQPLAGVVIGFDSKSIIGDASNYPILVADTMSSGYGYPTGYLHEILRDRGLVYMVHAMNSPGVSARYPGAFFVIAGCEPTAVNEVIDIALENIARLQADDEAMVPGWFDRAKQLMLVSDAMENETGSEQATSAALDELYGMGYDFRDKFVPSVREVTPDDIRTMARERLVHATVTVVTPNPELVKTETGQRTYTEFTPVDLTPRGVQHD